MIAILLSTYNGARFLHEQIESIIYQTYTDWKLILRDDGSIDNTSDIIEEYCIKYPNQIFIDETEPENLGAGKSFMHLLKNVEADYYMFCDQDDVWMPKKIERTLAKAQAMEAEFGKNVGIGVFTDLEVVDCDLNVLMPSLWKGDNRNPEFIRNFYKQWTNRHAAYGCTMLINRAAKDLVFPYRQFKGVQGGHDNWIEYILIKKGYIDYINETTIHYRQHGDNVIGANMGINYQKLLSDILKHPSHLKKLYKDYQRSRLFPFRISYSKILMYRLIQTIKSIIK